MLNIVSVKELEKEFAELENMAKASYKEKFIENNFKFKKSEDFRYMQSIPYIIEEQINGALKKYNVKENIILKGLIEQDKEYTKAIIKRGITIKNINKKYLSNLQFVYCAEIQILLIGLIHIEDEIINILSNIEKRIQKQKGMQYNYEINAIMEYIDRINEDTIEILYVLESELGIDRDIVQLVRKIIN